MTESYETNTYLILFKYRGQEFSLAIDPVDQEIEESFSIVRKNPNQEDISQIWVFDQAKQHFMPLIYPFMALTEENSDDKFSTLSITNITEEDDVNQTFSFYNNFIANKNLEKFVIPTEKSDSSFILSTDIPENVTMTCLKIDVSDYCIPYPIPEIPCAILFSDAAEEYALTMGPILSEYDSTRKLTFTPFRQELNPKQFWLYIPNHNNSIFSCAESDMVIKAVHNDETVDIVMANSNSNKKNQNWKIFKRCIYSSKYDSFMTVNQEDTNFVLDDDDSELADKQFYFYPLFNNNDAILHKNDVISQNDDLRTDESGSCEEISDSDNDDDTVFSEDYPDLGFFSVIDF
ncbi:hypothetical protein TVAG_088840 [Trichomonas vaginalis G3]|uniref:Uncharacterized protein n=1 Tax=Trichomonas vaginalis (strain ATCC PRA-98 / G3) TaxID=412133 RepID=A2EB29_TRIV3|nr:Ricin B-like lectins family [Trichomonas vaginalis G3]EAY10169.1 hypothetical protein TVAG_088840 [Trichomonas vaginalis G3]KAI5534451.1 Ricin B-like lectins family [Trichomonas vaginalis G3]|eukprot:XP_001322392.1 hypothetical protein [Trichomonas vaginalis G3]